jgi:hypothetical protein|tara:strand:- start:583 stop:1899 length:1317 start_codon:yes stop_codon:yes gene_type:complete
VENKKEKEKIEQDNQNTFVFSLSLIILIYFFYGFFSNENTAGAGGYNGDFNLIWENLTLFKEGIIVNLNNNNYTDSRTPLSYIIHVLFNPFIYNEEVFRLSNLLISSSIPFLLFFSIKEKYPKLDNSLLILLSLTVTLSPYFRTTSFWALGENYGIIFLLLSYLVYTNFQKNLNNFSNYKKLFIIFFLCLFSSLIVYFDQKLVFAPFLILLLLLNLRIEITFKIYTIILFFIFSLPYFYLIHLWGSFIPPSAHAAREVGSSIHLFHPGYCLTILMLTIFPFFFLNNKNLDGLKNKILNKNFIFILILFLFYSLLVVSFGDFENLKIDGKGAFHKLLLILIEDSNTRLIFTLIGFFFSLIFTYLIFDNKIDLLIIAYFMVLSIFTFPFYQEYLDPLFYILIFSFFKTKFKFENIKNVYLLVLYFFILSLSSKYYYQLPI